MIKVKRILRKKIIANCSNSRVVLGKILWPSRLKEAIIYTIRGSQENSIAVKSGLNTYSPKLGLGLFVCIAIL